MIVSCLKRAFTCGPFYLAVAGCGSEGALYISGGRSLEDQGPWLSGEPGERFRRDNWGWR